LSHFPLVFGLVVVLVLSVLAIPVKQRCGAPGYSCASALDTRGNVHYYYYYYYYYYYEVEPFGVYLAEIITGSNIRFYYASGEDVVKAR
jgi:hypothetical protein